MKDKKIIIYAQCGLGDYYDLFAMIPEIKKKYKTNRIKIFIDSMYFWSPGYQLEKETTIKMIEEITKDWEIVPMNVGSFRNLYYGSDEKDRVNGPQYEKIKNDFLFYRLPQTKEYMKSRIKENNIFISTIMGKYIYEWKDNTNILIDLKREPLHFDIPKKVLIHIRKKGTAVNNLYYEKILNYCLAQEFVCILIGKKSELNINIFHPYVIDLRNNCPLSEIMKLIEETDYMIGSSSMFTTHRLLFNKPTIIVTPVNAGSNEAVFRKDDLKNTDFLFLDGDNKLILNQVMEGINKWLN